VLIAGDMEINADKNYRLRKFVEEPVVRTLFDLGKIRQDGPGLRRSRDGAKDETKNVTSDE
jgi:hypothetical protein